MVQDDEQFALDRLNRLRYSEDIDLVQVLAEPIGPTVNALRDVLTWLVSVQARYGRALRPSRLSLRAGV